MTNKQDLASYLEVNKPNCEFCEYFIAKGTQWGYGKLLSPLCWLKTYRKDLLLSKCENIKEAIVKATLNTIQELDLIESIDNLASEVIACIENMQPEFFENLSLFFVFSLLDGSFISNGFEEKEKIQDTFRFEWKNSFLIVLEDFNPHSEDFKEVRENLVSEVENIDLDNFL